MKTSRQINAERKREGLPPLNFPLFRKVIKKLETAPTAYDQSDPFRHEESAPCGTAACIGGWADILAGNVDLSDPDAQTNLNRAGNALGLGGKDWAFEEDTERAILFVGGPEEDDGGWPTPYRQQWRKVKTARGQARVAIRYLRHIIATGKVTE